MTSSKMVKRGLLNLITGPMFAGKTTELLRRKREYQGETVLFKPGIDERYLIDSVQTHNGDNEPAVKLMNPQYMVYKTYETGTKHIFIDEIQLFDERVLKTMEFILSRGISITCSGLSLDYNRDFFRFGDSDHDMSEVIAAANKVDMLYALCGTCGAQAAYTQLLVSPGDNHINVGGADKYDVRCLEHHRKII